MDILAIDEAAADAATKYAPLSLAAWFGSGDSILEGAGDVLNGVSNDKWGFFNRACVTAGLGYIKAAAFGELGADYYPTRQFRLAGTEYTTHFLDEYGQNDFGPFGNVSNANMQANALKRWQAARDRQQVVYAVTITPRTTTTNQWGNAAGQTVTANEAVRVAYNTWIRAGAPCTISPATYPAPAAVGASGAVLAGQPGHPLTGYFELADAMETSRDSGKWKAADRVVTDGAITTGTATLTSATAAFTSSDVGAFVGVAGAGGAGAPLGVYITAVTNATTVTLSNTASTTVSGAAVAINPYTADGVHPTARGHIALAAVTDLKAAVAAHPPRVLREWVPVTFRGNGNDVGFSTNRQGGTSKIKHTIVPGCGYSALRLLFANVVRWYPGSSPLEVRASVEYTSKSYSATFGGLLAGQLRPGQPSLLSDPIALDVRSVAALDYLFTRTHVVALDSAVIDAAADTLTYGVPHGLAVGDAVVFPSTVGNVVAGTTYYVQSVPTKRSITIAATAGGALLDLTASGLSFGSIPTGLVMRGADGDATNFTPAGLGADLTGNGWNTAPANPAGVTTGGAFSPVAVLGRVARD